MRFVVTGLVGTLCLATAALAATGDALTVEGARVNVRAGPDAASPVVLQLDRGDPLIEIGRSGAWINVEIPHHGGRQGWIHDSLIGVAATAPAPGPTPTAGAGTPAEPTPLAQEGHPLVEIQGAGANVRERPSSSAPVITAIDGGRVVAELDRELGWVRVELPDGRRGWIYGELVAPAPGGRAPAPQAAAAPEIEQPVPADAAAAEAPTPEAEPARAPERAAALEPEPEPATERPAAVEPEPAPAEDRPRLEVLATTVSLRREPSRLAPVALQLERGREVIELSREAEWIEVAVIGSENDRGWVHRSLMGPAASDRQAVTAAVPEEAEEPDALVAEAEPAPTRVAISGGLVNVREGPGMEAPVLMQLDDGTEVSELGRQGAWVRIATLGPDRREGWVHQSLVEPVAERPAVASRPEPTGPAAAPEGPVTAARPEPPTAPPPEPAGVAAAPDPIAAAVPLQTAPAPEDKAPEDSQTVEARAEDTIDDGRFDRFKTSVESLNERVRRAAGVDVFSKVEDLGDGTVELTATEAWLAAPEAARRANLDTLFRLWRSVHRPNEPIVVRIVEGDGRVAMEQRRDEVGPAAGRFSGGADDPGQPGDGL